MCSFDDWVSELWVRHAQPLRFAQLRRAVQALSSRYVEQRTPRQALDSTGKRAAFAVLYGPIHFLLVEEVVRRLGAVQGGVKLVCDLGCGTLPAAVAWANALHPAAQGCDKGHSRADSGSGAAHSQNGGQHAWAVRIHGVDRHAWVVHEARRTLRLWRLAGHVRQGDMRSHRLGGMGSAVVAAFAINELDDHARETVGTRILEAARRGARVLIVEPMAGWVAPWWSAWSGAFVGAGGRSDMWRVTLDLPECLRELSHACGLRHDIIKVRTLYLNGARDAPPADGELGERRRSQGRPAPNRHPASPVSRANAQR